MVVVEERPKVLREFSKFRFEYFQLISDHL